MFNQFYSAPLQREQIHVPLTFLEFMVLCHCHPSLQYIGIPNKLLTIKEVKYGGFIRTHFRNPLPSPLSDDPLHNCEKALISMQ